MTYFQNSDLQELSFWIFFWGVFNACHVHGFQALGMFFLGRNFKPRGKQQKNWSIGHSFVLPSGKHTKNYGKSLFLMGKTTINGNFQ